MHGGRKKHSTEAMQLCVDLNLGGPGMTWVASYGERRRRRVRRIQEMSSLKFENCATLRFAQELPLECESNENEPQDCNTIQDLRTEALKALPFASKTHKQASTKHLSEPHSPKRNMSKTLNDTEFFEGVRVNSTPSFSNSVVTYYDARLPSSRFTLAGVSFHNPVYTPGAVSPAGSASGSTSGLAAVAEEGKASDQKIKIRAEANSDTERYSEAIEEWMRDELLRLQITADVVAPFKGAGKRLDSFYEKLSMDSKKVKCGEIGKGELDAKEYPSALELWSKEMTANRITVHVTGIAITGAGKQKVAKARLRIGSIEFFPRSLSAYAF